uniref:Uncharacterized protein n=1 Tax=Streptomyces avermitilis TaxID=33903 RepID=A0A499VEL7_STRAX|nr:hypothetical protein SAVMC3_06200 [Streptomyces avermitilis]
MGGKGDNCRQQDGQGEGYGQAAERGERSDHGRPCERAEISGCSDGADGSGPPRPAALIRDGTVVDSQRPSAIHPIREAGAESMSRPAPSPVAARAAPARTTAAARSEPLRLIVFMGAATCAALTHGGGAWLAGLL